MKESIFVHELIKKFGTQQVLKKVSFEVEAGELFSILGPNGAGKSTLLSILCGFAQPTSGYVRIDQKSWQKEGQLLKQEIGIVFQKSILDNQLTGRENLEIRSRFYHKNLAEAKSKALECAKAVDALDFLEKPYGTLSGGQQRRLDIARALLGDPRILFLDEPTTGLDVISRYRMWQMIQKLQREKNLTVILTTHYMEEAAVSNRILFLNEGKIIALDTPDGLKKQYGKVTLEEVFIAATIGGINQ